LPFLGTRDVFADLLARHPALGARWPLTPASHPADGHVDPTLSAANGFADPLTEREHAVLRFLATNLSAAEIATEMCVSVNTVKTHVAAIYRKLAASRRREAVLRARELELL
jgi:LuxR family maltose regulon positive regulatory protein